MRTSQDFQSIKFQIEELANSETVRNFSTELLSRLTPNPARKFTNQFRILNRKEENLVALSILSWYMNPEIGILLRLELEKITQEDPIFKFLLKSKSSMLIFLDNTNRWHTRDFFGNILNKNLLSAILKSFRPIYETKKKVKTPERIRGYRDKGSLRKNHEYHDFTDSSKEMIEMENQREIQIDTNDLLLGMLI